MSSVEVQCDSQQRPISITKKFKIAPIAGGKFSVCAKDCYNRELLCSTLAKELGFADVVPVIQKENMHDNKLTFHYVNYDQTLKDGARSLADNHKKELNFDQFSVEKAFVYVFLTRQLDAHANNILIQKIGDTLHKPVIIDLSMSLHFDDVDLEKSVVPIGRATDLFLIKQFEGVGASDDIIGFVDDIVKRYKEINAIFDNNRLYGAKKPTEEKNLHEPNFELILEILSYPCFGFLVKEYGLLKHAHEEWVKKGINVDTAINYFKDIEARLNFFIRLFVLQYQLKNQKEKPFFEIMRGLFDRCPYNQEKEGSTSEFFSFSDFNMQEVLSDIVLPLELVENNDSNDDSKDDIIAYDASEYVQDDNPHLLDAEKKPSEGLKKDDINNQKENSSFFNFKMKVVSLVTFCLLLVTIVTCKYYKKSVF